MLQLETIVIIILCLCGLARGCPGACQCSSDAWNERAICVSGNVADILAGLTGDITYLSITSATNAIYLTENDFSGAPSAVQISELILTKSYIQEIADNTFRKFRNLRELDLSYNNIQSIANNAFYGLNSLRILNLSNNQISVLNNVLKVLGTLQTLDLSYNQISNLPTQSFSSQNRLTSLVLDGNKMKNLNAFTFEDLNNLQSLSLKNCGMRVIANGLFSIIHNINKLDISDNILMDIPNDQEFRNLSGLNQLYVQNNQIKNLKNQQFSGMSLDILDLSKNQIRDLSKNVFQYFNVRMLDLSANMFEEMESNTFRPLAPYLETLNLAKNSFRTIHTQVFDGLYRLMNLNLSACKLHSLEMDPFQSLPALREVDLSSNYLRNVPQNVVNVFNQLRLLRLYNNPWHCDCDIKPLQSWLQLPRFRSIIQCDPNTGFSTECREQKCVSPAKLLQYPIASVEEQNLEECSEESVSQGLPSGLIIGAVITCIVLITVPIVVVCICRRYHPFNFIRFQICGKSYNGSHNIGEENKCPPLKEFDVGSLNETDRGFAVRNYFNSLDPDCGDISRGLPSLTQICASTGSQLSLCTSTFSYPMGRESTV